MLYAKVFLKGHKLTESDLCCDVYISITHKFHMSLVNEYKGQGHNFHEVLSMRRTSDKTNHKICE